ncbi:hypothetical protein EV192_106522 [Actinocrispum wychmicini]|uniref:Uncharacterized protein n=1 Tax=Actinocrispum wychmicini TaxID=1213861 RepID=A0A4R2JET0_9PSEU|nr:hypothetical protein EV192_106522 [Actinocrispum wychmicini]
MVGGWLVDWVVGWLADWGYFSTSGSSCPLSRPTWAQPNHACQEVRLRDPTPRPGDTDLLTRVVAFGRSVGREGAPSPPDRSAARRGLLFQPVQHQIHIGPKQPAKTGPSAGSDAPAGTEPPLKASPPQEPTPPQELNSPLGVFSLEPDLFAGSHPSLEPDPLAGSEPFAGSDTCAGTGPVRWKRPFAGSDTSAGIRLVRWNLTLRWECPRWNRTRSLELDSRLEPALRGWNRPTSLERPILAGTASSR